MSIERWWVIAALLVVIALLYAPLEMGSAISTVRTSFETFLGGLGVNGQ